MGSQRWPGVVVLYSISLVSVWLALLPACDWGLWGSDCLTGRDCPGDQVCRQGLCTPSTTVPISAEFPQQESPDGASESSIGSRDAAPEQGGELPRTDLSGMEFVPEKGTSCPSCPPPWLFQLSTTSADLIIHATAKGADGAVYVAGTRSDDLFVAKLSTKGDIVWQFSSKRDATSDGSSIGMGIALDRQGNVIVVGQHGKNHQIGPMTLALSGSINIHGALVVKLSPQGKLLWVLTGGGNRADRIHDVVLDDQDQIFVAGIFSRDSVFGSIHRTTAGVYDSFVAQVSSEGKWKWVQTVSLSVEFTSPNYKSHAYALARGPDGHLLMGGIFSHQVKVGETILTPLSAKDVYLAQIGADGAWKWAKAIIGFRDQIIEDLQVDAQGATYVLCSFPSEVRFEKTYQFQASQDGDFALAKLDASGRWVWAIASSGDAVSNAKAVGIDGAGNVLIAGHFTGNMSLGGKSYKSLHANGSSPFVAKFDNAGKLLWVTVAHSSSAKTAVTHLHVDSKGNSVVVGQFANELQLGHATFRSGASPGFVGAFAFQLDAKGQIKPE